MSLVGRLKTGLTRSDPSLAFDDFVDVFSFNNLTYQLNGYGTLAGREERPPSSFAGYVQLAYHRNGVVFACMLARLLLFSEARFQFRQLRSGRPGDLFGNAQLRPLEKPWPGGTTGDLLARAIQDVDLAGNAYLVRRGAGLLRLRPDWVTIVAGTDDPDGTIEDIDAEVLGYVYQPGGPGSGQEPVPLLAEQVAHFAPIPDPIARFRGMSWLTPVIREILADSAATSHKLRFFENGATPNMMVTLDLSDYPLAERQAQFDAWVRKFRQQHEKAEAAYKTMFLAGGSTATVVGKDMRQIDFKVTQGHGETRIAAAAGVPPVVVGLSEGLEAATYSNYAQARRRFADMTMRPLWRNIAGSLERVISTPDDAELWYDDRDIPALQEDQKDAAEIQGREADTVRTLIEAGFDPQTVIDAVTAGDFGRLEHTGRVSVQLHDPSENSGSSNGSGDASAVPAPG